MATYECTLRGDYDQALRYLHEGILNGSASASFEGENYFQSAGVRVTVRVYERYSFAGGTTRNTITLSAWSSGISGGCCVFWGRIRRERSGGCWILPILPGILRIPGTRGILM